MNSLTVTVLICLVAVLLIQPSAPPVSPPPAPLGRLGRLPIYFIANQGQVHPQVAYYIQGHNTSIYFSQQSVTVLLSEPSLKQSISSIRPVSVQAGSPQSAYAVEVAFVNANPAPVIVPKDPAAVFFSHFRGTPDQWRTSIPTYRAVLYKDVWPGIDVEFAGPDGNLKYTFLVHPGANPSLIRLSYNGASSLSLATDGALRIDTPAGSFYDAAPVAWQTRGSGRRPVEAAFALHRASVSFSLGPYDPSRELAIDPIVLLYSGYLGGTGDEEVTAAAIDPSGSLYVVGSTYSADFPEPKSFGSVQGFRSGFITKISPDGSSIVYSAIISSLETVNLSGVAVDSAGSAYVTGLATPAGFPVVVGPGLGALGATSFVLKLNPQGNALIYSGFLSAFPSTLNGIAVDISGAAYVVGSSFNRDIPFVNVTDAGANSDVLVAKIQPSGASLAYAKLIGGGGPDYGSAIAIDVAGNAYVVGRTDSGDFPSVIGPDLIPHGFTDAFLTKINASGESIVYSTYIGGSNLDEAKAVAVDAAGNAYVVGDTYSVDFPVSAIPGAKFHGDLEAFVVKVNPSGSAFVYSRCYGGSRNDHGTRIAVDSVGNAYLTGATESVDLHLINDIGIPSFNGDIYIAKLSAAGDLLVYSARFGGGYTENSSGIVVDSHGAAYVTGITSSPNIPTVVGPDLSGHTLYPNFRSIDGFVTKIAPFPAAVGPTIAFRDTLGGIRTSTLPTPGTRNAGGLFYSDPAMATSPSGRAFVVARDRADPLFGSLYLTYLQPTNTYANWQSLGGVVQGTPAVTTVVETAWITARDRWGAYWVTSYTPGGPPGSWILLGGVFGSDPVIASCPDGSVYVAGREPYGAIWTRRYAANTATWRDWTNSRGVTKGKPALVCGSDNAAYISTRDPFDALWLARVAGETPGVWNPGGGILTDDTQIITNGNTVQIFGLASSAPWYRIWQIGSGWQPWTPIRGVLAHISAIQYGGYPFLAGQDSLGNLWWWNGLSNSWINQGNNSVASNSRFAAAPR